MPTLRCRNARRTARLIAGASLARIVCTTAILTLFTLSASHAQRRLYPIEEQGKWGYMDSNGIVVIQPQYDAAGAFAAGLAPVRTQGVYGYIDETGAFAIAPRYDFAQPFSEQRARVYSDGRGTMIDTRGTELFTFNILQMGADNFGAVRYRTTTVRDFPADAPPALGSPAAERGPRVAGRARGLAAPAAGPRAAERRRSGTSPSNARALWHAVLGIPPGKTGPEFECAVMGDNGIIVIPPGRFDEIETFRHGLAYVLLPHTTGDSTITRGFIDTAGTLVMQFPVDRTFGGAEYLGEDRWWFGRWLGDAPHSLLFGIGPTLATRLVDRTGRVIVEDSTFSRVFAFSEGRAFAVRRANTHVILIDRDGRRIGSGEWLAVLPQGFQHGVALVRTAEGWGGIDTNGRTVFAPSFAKVDRDGIHDGYFFIRRIAHVAGADVMLDGVADDRGRIIVEPHRALYDDRDCGPGLIRMRDSAGLAYVDRRGRLVWRAAPDSAAHPLNIDYTAMIGVAVPPPGATVPCLGDPGVTICPAIHRRMARVTSSPATRRDAGLAIVVHPKIDSTTPAGSGVITVDVVNAGRRRATIETMNQCIPLWLEARNTRGEWEKITTPFVVCDVNSFTSGTSDLAAGQSWRFMLPRFDGGDRVKLRYALSPTLGGTIDNAGVLYSDEFVGSINRAQFWRSPLIFGEDDRMRIVYE